MAATPFFDVPLNLPRAGRAAERIRRIIEQRAFADDLRYLQIADTADTLDALLMHYRLTHQDPPEAEAEAVRKHAADLGRRMVNDIERLNLGGDRLGQCIRNLFECLALGEEGAAVSLRAGENPESLHRPR